MCVAAPGMVVSVDEEKKTATIDFDGVTREASTGFVSVKTGDRVMVHAGCVIQVLSMTQEEEISELSKVLEEVGAF